MKNKRVGWFIVALAVFAIALTGCKSSKVNKAYDNSIAKGLDAVAQDKIDKAASYFENALDQKPKDTKAKAYLKQANGYVDTEQALKDGDPAKANKIVAKVVTVKNGAKSLTRKLKALQTTVTADLKEYTSLKATLDQATKQSTRAPESAKTTLATVKETDWANKPYLAKLKSAYDTVNKTVTTALAKKAAAAKAAAAKAAAAKAAATKAAALHSEAQAMRQGIVESSGGSDGIFLPGELAKVPDAVVVAAEKKSSAEGGDPGVTGGIIAEQYPNIKNPDPHLE